MESLRPLPALDIGTLPGDVADGLGPLVERLAVLLPPPPEAAEDRGVSLALFDSGPGQLGTPRVAQVAAWIALDRRAATAGLGFAWGVVQEPGEGTASGITLEGLLRLLGSRTPHEAGGEQLAVWRGRLEAWPEVEEVWMVGPPRLGAPPTLPGTSLLQLWDDLTPGERRVGFAIRSDLCSSIQSFLDLPDETDCVRLLRLAGSPAEPGPSRLSSQAEEAETVAPALFTQGAAFNPEPEPDPSHREHAPQRAE